MIYVLLLVVSGGFRNIAIAAPEFNTKEACIAAGQAAEKRAEYVSWACVEKGKPAPRD